MYVVCGGVDVTLFPEKYLQWGATCAVVGQADGNVHEIFTQRPRGVVKGEPGPIHGRPLWEHHRPLPWQYPGHPDPIAWPEALCMATRGCPYKCSFCFPPGVLVQTYDGLKPIESITEGTRVWTHKGRYRPVDRRFQHQHDGVLTKVKLDGIPDYLVGTPNHRVLVIRRGRTTCKWQNVPCGHRTKSYCASGQCPHKVNWSALEPDWVSLDDLSVGDYVLYTFSTEESSLPDTSPEMCRLVGYYLAEGSLGSAVNSAGTRYKYVVFTIGAHEQDILADISRLCEAVFGKTPSVYTNEVNHTLQIQLYVEWFHEWLEEHCGSGAADKHLPEDWMSLPVQLQREILIGLWRGDGYANSSIARYTTVSANLALQIRHLMFRLGLPVSVFRQPVHKRTGGKINGRAITPRHDAYFITAAGLAREEVRTWLGMERDNTLSPRERIRVFPKKGWALHPVRSIESVAYDGPVYNLSVRSDHSYTASWLTVKNCGNIIWNGQRARRREVDDVVEELHWLKDHGVKAVFFYDDEIVSAPTLSYLLDIISKVDGLEQSGRASLSCPRPM